MILALRHSDASGRRSSCCVIAASRTLLLACFRMGMSESFPEPGIYLTVP